MTRRPAPRDVVACGAMVLLAVLPLLPALLRGDVPGHPTSDLVDHAQGSWWFGGELLAGRFPRAISGFLAPDGGALWYPDPIGALLALPFRPFGPFAAHTATIVLQLALGAAVAWAAARRRLSFGGALVAAAVIGPNGYAWSLVHSGVSEYLGAWAVTAFVFAWVDAVEGDRRAAVVSAVALAVAGLQAFYDGLFVATFAVVVAVGAARRSPPWSRLAGALVVGMIPVLLAAIAARSTFGAGAAIDPATAPGFRPVVPPGTDPWSFVVPWDWYHPDTPALGNPGILEANPLPWVALGLAVVGLRGAAWAPAAIAWAVLSLGPSLALFGADRPLGVRIPLPAALLWATPAFEGVHHPYRMVVVTLPVLGWLAGRGLERLVDEPRRTVVGIAAAAAIVGQIALASPAPLPLVATPRPDTTRYEGLPDGIVLDWPPDLRGPNRAYAWAALAHGRPVPYGVNAFLSRALREDPEVRALAAPLDLSARTINRDTAPIPPWLPARDHGGLVGLGVVAVVLHREHLSAAEATATAAWLDAHATPVGADRWLTAR